MKNHIISFLLFTVFCSVNLFCQQNGRNYIITRTLLSEDESKEEFYKLKYCSTVVYMVPRA